MELSGVDEKRSERIQVEFKSGVKRAIVYLESGRRADRLARVEVQADKNRLTRRIVVNLFGGNARERRDVELTRRDDDWAYFTLDPYGECRVRVRLVGGMEQRGGGIVYELLIQGCARVQRVYSSE